jgi:hypothetical protein
MIVMNFDTKSTVLAPFKPIFEFEGMQTYPEHIPIYMQNDMRWQVDTGRPKNMVKILNAYNSSNSRSLIF